MPLEFRNRLASVAAAVVSASSDASWSGAAAFMGGGDVRGSAAAIAEFHAANNGDLTPGTLKLLEGSLSERRWAARVMWHVGEGSTALATGLLLSLVHDADPVVRATAVIGLVRFVRAGQINDVILGAIDTAAREDALRVPRALAESLAAKPAAATQSPTEDDLLAGVRTYLAGHPRWVIARNFTAATSD